MEGKEKRKAGDSSSSIQAEEEGDGWNKIRGLKAKVVCFNRKLVAVVVGERETRIEQKVDNTCTGGATATSCRRHGRQLILFFFWFPFWGFLLPPCSPSFFCFLPMAHLSSKQTTLIFYRWCVYRAKRKRNGHHHLCLCSIAREAGELTICDVHYNWIV